MRRSTFLHFWPVGNITFSRLVMASYDHRIVFIFAYYTNAVITLKLFFSNLLQGKNLRPKLKCRVSRLILFGSKTPIHRHWTRYYTNKTIELVNRSFLCPIHARLACRRFGEKKYQAEDRSNGTDRPFVSWLLWGSVDYDISRYDARENFSVSAARQHSDILIWCWKIVFPVDYDVPRYNARENFSVLAARQHSDIY